MIAIFYYKFQVQNAIKIILNGTDTKKLRVFFRSVLQERLKTDFERKQNVGWCDIDQCFSTAGPRPGAGPREAWEDYYMLQDLISPIDN